VSLALEVAPDAEAAASRVGELIVARVQEAIAKRGRFSAAVSKAPPTMLRVLAEDDLSWTAVRIYQVDDRVAQAGHADRNLTHLLAALPDDSRGSVVPMPVEDRDLEEAANRYAAELPAQLDLVHLGLGLDGHTASLVPGDPVLEVRDRLVAVTAEYQGRRRMTLTYPALDAAQEIVWLVTGEEKRDAVAKLLARDPSIPAARVANPRQLLVCDQAAAGLVL
jgi:6-phosphogluconolactonase